MPHISKNKISEETLLKIENNFTSLLFKLSDKDEAQELLEDIFTPTEKIMLAKRIAIIVLCLKGVSAYVIWNHLKVSPSTVARIQTQCEKGKFSFINKKINESKSGEKILDLVQRMLSFGLPPRVGKGRWVQLGKM